MVTLFGEVFSEQLLLKNGIVTAILIVTLLILRAAAMRLVRRTKWASDQVKLRWTVQVRWAWLILLALGLVFIWAAELRSLALSVVAIAAAVVIATKELILCLSGSVLRAASRSFTVGDRIEIGGIRGDVIDIGALTTTLLELGPAHRRTGRAVALPNSLLLSSALTNETFTDDFVLHMITVPVAESADWEAAEARLLEVANEVCAPFLDDARKHLDATARRHGLPGFPANPSVSLQVPEPGKFNLLLRAPCRARDKSQTEQAILRRFFRHPSPPTA